MNENFEEKLFNKLVYYCWCQYMEENNFMTTKIHEKYLRFVDDAKIHFGDCTLDATSCMRCVLNKCEIEAQKLYNYIMRKEQ